MGERKTALSGREHYVAVNDVPDSSERLMQAVAKTSAIGFAIIDNHFRFQAINRCLAEINGIPAKAHLGFSTREIFGELSEKIAEPCYRRVLAYGETSHFEVTNAVLPTRGDSRFWSLNINFPILDRAGGVQQIGIIVVDVTQQRKLEKVLRELAGELQDTRTKETFWQVKELQDSIEQYHAALAVASNLLIRQQATNKDQLRQSVETLDERISAMRTLICEVAKCFPTPAG
jgi:PAS domain S-box-containing protein